MPNEEPWDPGIATDEIRAIAKSLSLSLTYKMHARERLSERNLIISDVLYALKHGFVYRNASPALKTGLYCYRVECRTPNSGSRSIGVVVIPEKATFTIAIITVMWIDEFERIAGSIIGDRDE